jgi:ATP-dependent RNA helicase RhlE
MTFDDLELIDPIRQAVQEIGYETPTPIQEQAIPIVLTGRDLQGCAQTGTGKTAAFSIPILQQLYLKKPPGHGKRSIKCLILTPTRELAIQIEESLSSYGKHTGLFHAVIFGGVSSFHQIKQLQRGVDILVATPGRLLDLMNQGVVSLQHIEIFVLDEADRMLDMGFKPDVKRVMNRLPTRRQTLFFSATMPPDIQELADELLTNPAKIAVTPVSSTVEMIEQRLYYVERDNKVELMLHCLYEHPKESCLIFSRTKHGADKLVKFLLKAGFGAAAIHGNKSQTARQKALQQFKNRDISILVATDIAARGIDIDGLALVINFELPDVPETYVHRIGRTGRAGHSGLSLSFCDSSERIPLRDIQKLIGKTIEVVTDHPYASDVPADRSRNAPAQKSTHHIGQPRQQSRQPERPPMDRNSNAGRNDRRESFSNDRPDRRNDRPATTDRRNDRPAAPDRRNDRPAPPANPSERRPIAYPLLDKQDSWDSDRSERPRRDGDPIQPRHNENNKSRPPSRQTFGRPTTTDKPKRRY